MSLATGTVLQNRYRIVSLLGLGGMGAVYRAWDLRLQIPVALKEMDPQLAWDPNMAAQLRAQFRQEALVLSQLNHPNLVRVTDYFEENNNVYLIMNFVQGESLSDFIGREGQIPEKQVLEWAKQLLDALAYCHQRGIIHRDIKPQNIILQPDGKIILVDFGLVKLWNPNDPRTQTVMRGMGSPEYAPPEQYGRQGQYTDARSDLYSLGATLYHALTGQSPPTASDRMATPQLFRPVHSLAMNVSKTTETAIMQALELPRDRRFADAPAMARALLPATPANRVKLFPWLWLPMGALFLVGIAVSGLLKGSQDKPPTPAMLSNPTPSPIVTRTPTPPTPTTPPTSTPAPPTPTLRPGTAQTRTMDGMVQVYVPQGKFLMGSTNAEIDAALAQCEQSEGISKCQRSWFTNEQPLHTVTLSDFWLDQTEVTNVQYRQCINAGICTPHDASSDCNASKFNADSQPVICVNWEQAQTYCQWVGGRLPTEAEWEYAARGPGERIYPWGDSFDGTLTNFCDKNCGNSWKDRKANDGYAWPAPAGSFPAGKSWCQALDLAGNVWEWVADWYDGGAYPTEGQVNPSGPANGSQRVKRGGSWSSGARDLRGAVRGENPPGDGNDIDLGFRCVTENP